MTNFFYYSGIVAWLLLSVASILAFGDKVIDWTIDSLWTKREFLAFVADRLRRRSLLSQAPPSSSEGGASATNFGSRNHSRSAWRSTPSELRSVDNRSTSRCEKSSRG